MNADREKFLLFRVRRFGDDKSFGELHMEYEARILRFLTYKLPTHGDVEDVTNEVFLRAWNYAKDTPIENFGGVLYQIARNVCASFYRTRGRRPMEVELEAAAELSGQGAEEIIQEVSTTLSIEGITACLPKLKEEYRDVVIMRYLDEMTVREVADVLEKSEGSVRMLIHRALVIVRQIMDKKIPTYDDQP